MPYESVQSTSLRKERSNKLIIISYTELLMILLYEVKYLIIISFCLVALNKYMFHSVLENACNTDMRNSTFIEKVLRTLLEYVKILKVE